MCHVCMHILSLHLENETSRNGGNLRSSCWCILPKVMERSSHQIKKLAEVAGLDKREEAVQTLTFVDDLSASDFKLIEMPNELLDLITEKGSHVVLRGDKSEEAVLCTENATYELRAADTSNILLLLPSLKTPKCKGFRDIGDSPVDLKIVGNVSSYYELKKSTPKLAKLREILGLAPYRGPEYESSNANNRYTFDDLKDKVQASEVEISKGLERIGAFCLDDCWRTLDISYKEKAFAQILKLTEEKQWDLDAVPLERTCEILNELYPREVIQTCFGIFGERVDCSDEPEVMFRLIEDRVCQFFAECILRGAEKFNYNEFFEAWQQSVPDGLQTKKEQLKGIVLEDFNSHPPVIWHFPAYELPDEPSERFNRLFKVRVKWTRDELEPYIKDLCGPSLSMNALLLKFARCSTDSTGNKIYNSKKPI